MILADANVLMYAVGEEHPHKSRSLSFLSRVSQRQVAAAIDAEVLQEILHRYRSMGRLAKAAAAYAEARLVFDTVFPITVEVTDTAVRLLGQYPALVARDAVHAAVVLVYGLDGICSFDRDFDRIREFRRVEPA